MKAFVVFCPRCLRGKTRATQADVDRMTARFCADCARAHEPRRLYLKFEAISHNEAFSVVLRARMLERWKTT